MKNVNDLIAHCKKAINDEVKYIYGAKYQKLTYNQIKALQNMYGKSLIWDADLSKAGQWCCDCSGLISSCTGIERNSSNYKETATKVITLAELKKNWSNYIGYGLHMSGHIGIVSETYNYYYAMDGSARNMVKFPMEKQSWTSCIKLKDIDYTGGYIDMEELKKLQETITALNNTITNMNSSIKNIQSQIATINSNIVDLQSKQEQVYNTIEEVPDWGRATIQKLVNKGLLSGSGNGLNLSYSLLRLLVINDRAGLYN